MATNRQCVYRITSGNMQRRGSMLKTIAFFAICTGLLIVTGCKASDPSPGPAASAPSSTLLGQLENFRRDYSQPPTTYEQVAAAKKKLRAIMRSISEQDQLLAAQDIYRALGEGDTLTNADSLMVWICSPAIRRNPPPDREVLLAICRKIDNRGKSLLSKEPLEECLMMLFEVLEPHVGAPPVRTVGGHKEIDWSRWAKYRDAVAAWKKPS